MHIERLTLTNFRCFESSSTTIALDAIFTAFVGANGAGKTAAFAALGRMFGVTRAERQVVPEDFYIGPDETETPTTRDLSIEVVIAFPELADDDIDPTDNADAEDLDEDGVDLAVLDDHTLATIPEFFRQMATSEDGELKCRFRMDAKWTDDGSVDGTVTESLRVTRTFDDNYSEDDCSPLRAVDRTRIQMVYLPASRDGARHLTAFLKSRLWKAARWSDALRSAVEEVANDIGARFSDEPVVAAVEQAVSKRWRYLHRSVFDVDPSFRPIDRDFSQLVNKAQILFTPSEAGRERSAEQLSDGQRSLLQIALTSATIDIETSIASGGSRNAFDMDAVDLPSLTLLVVEEPENSLSPQFLSRIVSQIRDIGVGARAQTLVSSHSASVLGRVDPRAVRHFRIDEPSLAAVVNCLALPGDATDDATYVREAVRAFPELYFARFVVLGEGSSEEVVIPRLAEAAGTLIDQAFVAVVPLGGRHVNHFWRLLAGLNIPHVTLLDLDVGRAGGGEGRLQTACRELGKLGIHPLEDLAQFGDVDDIDGLDESGFAAVVDALKAHNVVFCAPLDLDMTMLVAFSDAYRQLDEKERGPQDTPAYEAVLGAKGSLDDYEGWDDNMQWYRYLFLGRSKPTTHMRALRRLDDGAILAATPDELKTVVDLISNAVN